MNDYINWHIKVLSDSLKFCAVLLVLPGLIAGSKEVVYLLPGKMEPDIGGKKVGEKNGRNYCRSAGMTIP